MSTEPRPAICGQLYSCSSRLTIILILNNARLAEISQTIYTTRRLFHPLDRFPYYLLTKTRPQFYTIRVQTSFYSNCPVPFDPSASSYIRHTVLSFTTYLFQVYLNLVRNIELSEAQTQKPKGGERCLWFDRD